jgi:lipid-binding SYLF domain-containing protein
MMAIVAIAGCATSPPTKPSQSSLEHQAGATLGEMRAKDPSIDNVLHGAYAFAVFPEIGKAGVGVGGAFGRGVLYEHGQPTGFVKLEQGTVGASLGGQTYAELLVLKNADDVARLKSGEFDLGADVSAVAIKAGAAAATDFRSGTAVFVLTHGGLMIEAAVGGQRIEYVPAG